MILFRKWLFLLAIIIAGCATSSVPIPEYLQHKTFKDKDVLHIESINLSEDGSVLSTKDDEVLIFFYLLKDGVPSELLFSKEQTFKAESPWFHVTINCEEEYPDYLLVLLEQDTEQSIDQYDDIIRQHLDQMKTDHLQKDYQSIEAYLGDDDILAIQRITNDRSQAYNHHGSHRGDQYHYRSIFKSKR